MVTSLLSGIILGFILAIPPGPIAVAVMKAGLQDNGRKGVGIGIGAALMDVFYCLVVLMATAPLAGQVTSLLDNNQTLVLILQIACVAAMIIYGVINLRTHRTSPQSELEGGTGSSLVERIGSKGPFFIGVGISLTNLVNPTFLPSIGSMSVLLQKFGFVDTHIVSQLLFSVGFGAGMMGWIALLLRTILKYRSRMSPRLIGTLHRFTGITFIGFGTYIGYRAFSVVKWPELLRLLLSF